MKIIKMKDSTLLCSKCIKKLKQWIKVDFMYLEHSNTIISKNLCILEILDLVREF